MQVIIKQATCPLFHVHVTVQPRKRIVLTESKYLLFVERNDIGMHPSIFIELGCHGRRHFNHELPTISPLDGRVQETLEGTPVRFDAIDCVSCKP